MTANTVDSPPEKIWRTRLSSWGTSKALRIPKEVCEAAGLSLGDEVDMTTRHDADGISVVIRNAQGKHRSFASTPRISLRELFNDYRGDYQVEEADWGEDVGSEVVR